ncbi:MAG: alpha/beta hydrolase [Methylococcaceae bacterium]
MEIVGIGTIFIGILGIAIAIWQTVIARQRLNIELKKLTDEKQENELQRLANSAPKAITHQFELTRNFISRLSSAPEQVEHQSIEYLIETGRSKECIVFLSGLGLDHRDFERHIQAFQNFDCIVLTVYGFQPIGGGFVPLELNDHVKVLVHVLNQLFNGHNYDKVNFVGFSVGADLSLRIVANEELKLKFHRLIILDPNFDKSTLFISKRISKLTNNASSLDVVKAISSDSKFLNLDDWLDVHRYLVKIFAKFGPARLPVLQKFASEIVETYGQENLEYFISLVAAASGQVANCNLVLSDNVEHEKIKSRLKGKLPINVAIDIIQSAGHFDLVKNLVITRKYIEKA